MTVEGTGSSENQQPTEPTATPRRKKGGVLTWVILTAGFLVLFAFGVRLGLKYYSSVIFGTILQAIVEIKSDGLYSVEFDKSKLSFLDREFGFTNLRLKVNREVWERQEKAGIQRKVLYECYIPQVKFSTTSLIDMYLKKELTIESCEILSPDIRLQFFQVEKEASEESQVNNLFFLISDYLKTFKVNEFLFKAGSLSIDFPTAHGPHLFRFREIDLGLTGFRLDSLSQISAKKPFFIDDVFVEMGANQFTLPGSPHRFYFDHFRFAVSEQHVGLKGLTINTPKTPATKQFSQLSIRLPNFEMEGVDIGKIYFDSVLQASHIHFQRLALDIDLPQGQAVTSFSLLESLPLKSVAIGNIQFDSTYLDVQGGGFAPEGLLLPDFDLSLFQFQFDSSTYARRASQLWIDDFDLTARNISRALPDRIHTVKAREVGISTRQRSLFVNNILISPAVAPAILLDQDKDKMYQAYATRLALNAVDIWGLYLQQRLQASSIRVRGPNVVVHQYSLDLAPPRMLPDSLQGFTDSLYTLLPDSATLARDSLLVVQKALLESPVIVTGNDSLLGGIPNIFEDLVASKPKEVPSLTDSNYVVSMDTLLKPRPLLFPKAMALGKPILKPMPLQPVGVADSDMDSLLLALLYQMISPVLKEVRVREVEVINGDVEWLLYTVEDTVRRLRAANVGMKLEDVWASPATVPDTTRLLFSRHFSIDIDQIYYLDSDGLEKLEIAKMMLSSKDSALRIEQFKYVPLSKDRQFVLNAVENKKDIFDFKARSIALEGVDYNRVFRKQEITLKSIFLADPNLNHFTANRGQASGDPVEIELREIIARKNAFLWIRKMDVRSVELENGFYALINLKGYQSDTYSMSNFNLCLRGLSLDSAALLSQQLKFNLEDIELNGFNYRMQIAGQNHILKVRRVGYSLSNQAMYAYDLQVEPLLFSRLGRFEDVFTINIPEIWLEGADLVNYYEKKTLAGKKLFIREPEVDVRIFLKGNDQKPAKREITFQLEDLYRYVSASAVFLQMELLEIEQGQLNLAYTTPEGNTGEISTGEINVAAHDFLLDSMQRLSDQNFLYARDIQLNVKNYLHHFPDQLHTLRVSEWGISTEKPVIYGKYVHLAPQNWADERFYQRRDDQQPLLELYAPTVLLEGYAPYGLYKGDSLGVGKLTIDEPKVRAILYSQEKDTLAKPFQTDQLFGLIEPFFPKYHIEEASLVNAGVEVVVHAPDDSLVYQCERAFAGLKGFRANARSVVDDPRFMYADDLSFVLHDVSLPFSDSLYRFKAKRVGFTTGGEQLFVDQWDVRPVYSRDAIAEILGHETDWMNFSGNKISFSGFDFKAFTDERKWIARHAMADQMLVNVYRDKRPPSPYNRRPKMPQQALREAPYYIRIDTATLANMSVTYEELSVDGVKPGRVFLNNMYVYAYHISNDSADLAEGLPTRVFMDANFMGAAHLSVNVVWNAANPDNKFNYSGELAPMDATVLSPLLEDLVGIRVNSGQSKAASFRVAANEEYAEGVMKLRYNNLRVSLIDKETKKVGFGKSMTSFFANLVLVKSNNPRFLFTKKGRMYYERDKSKSIFNYMVKTSLSGVKHSVGFSNEKPPKDRRKSVFDFWKTIKKDLFSKEGKQQRKY